MKKNLFMMLLALVGLASCNEPDKTMRDNKKLPELIEHCITLSDNEIISYMQDNGYSLVRDENIGADYNPFRYLYFSPIRVSDQNSEGGEELEEEHNESANSSLDISFEMNNVVIFGRIIIKGDPDYKLSFYKVYTEWAHQNLPEFSSYDWHAYIFGRERYLDGSMNEENPYGLGGYKEYMQAIANDSTFWTTHNYAIGPNNTTSRLYGADYELIFQSNRDCSYTRILCRETK